MKVVTVYTINNDTAVYEFDGKFYGFYKSKPKRVTAKKVIEGKYMAYLRPEDMNFTYTGERFVFK
jgi:hypothetical protein